MLSPIETAYFILILACAVASVSSFKVLSDNMDNGWSLYGLVAGILFTIGGVATVLTLLIG